ncbi:DUF4214 domain-containing protein [Undibacterium cyanobacteriorum]|uniref:DUF4214 domain-containing protein n=1 Tax=Undibacterium cyanobacteriorum TaxID=3073561 RepID=A0ABY9RFC5_9BURK|nr:DUF4214 domain-containing protein [Undibacterium sp. 20NA77.5]WMW79928.1 DUF4214 domain-containing protein [Undibacterium sp. 20NA77.5]
MPDLYLTTANDDYSQTEAHKNIDVNVFGLEGDDKIQIYGGNAIGGKGNDTLQIIPIATEPWRQVIAAYWDGAPGKVVVDLQAGWALDGWGTRDTLIGVEAAAGGGGETELYGSANSNNFWVGGYNKSIVDGRDGFDVLNLPWFTSTPAAWSDFTVKVSIDGKSAQITATQSPSFNISLTNVEALSIWDGNVSSQKSLSDFVTVQSLAESGLVQGDANRWNASKALGTAVEVSFSFVLQAPASGVGASQFRSFSVAEKEVVRKIFTDLSALTGLSFKEVDETSGQTGSIRFGVSQQTASKGTSYFPGEAGDAAGDVWMDIESMLALTPGTEGYAALLHEIGHALGLRHPSNIDANDHYAQEILPAFNQTAYTVMSQNYSSDGLFPSTWGTMDLAALRYLYGSRSVNVGNTTISLGDGQSNSQTSIVDDGGVDLLDASASKVGVSIDLQPGHLSSFGVTANGIPAVNNLSIAVGTVIEDLKGSALDDYLLGNDVNNKITGGDGNDWIDGAGGVDTAIFTGPRNNYFISSSFGKFYIAARDGSAGFDTILSIEKLQFADKAFDLSYVALGSDLEVAVDLGSTVNSTLPAANDLADGVAKYALVAAPKYGTATVNANGDFTYFAAPGAEVGDSFTYSISDDAGHSNQYTVFVDVAVGTEVINGTANNDNINGGLTNDLINAMAGDDTITGAGGNDVIEGGAGIDTAIYAGKLADYRLSLNAGNYTVVAKTGSEGIDTLSHVEKLQFSDINVNLLVQGLAASAPTATVQRLMELYVAFFNRVPDADGMAYWISESKAGKSIYQIADIFYGAGVMFSDLTGFSSTMTNIDFIRVVYRNVLGRADGGDAEGVNYWNNELSSGKASRGSLVSTMLDAAHSFKGDKTWGWVADLLDNKIVVAKTFSIDWGLGYTLPEDAIRHGMEIAAAVTPTDISKAISLVGINGADMQIF